MRYFEGTPIDFSALCIPRVEVEVGFILGEDLPGEVAPTTTSSRPSSGSSVDRADRLAHQDWKITLPDTIADNASSCGWILGQERVRIADIDTGNIDATLTRNGEVIAEGNSSAVLGHPLNAVSWLANKVSSFGVRCARAT